MSGYDERYPTLEAFVLHRRPYRETSYIVDTFSRELGKLSMVCKGVRGSKTDKKSLLQPFQPLQVRVYGKHELKNLAAVESAGRSIRLVGNASYCGFYLNELLNRTLLPEVAFEALYDHYQLSLLGLSETPQPEPVLRHFEIALLDALGYGIDWFYEEDGETAVEPDYYYTFINEQGFRRLDGPQPGNNCFTGAAILALGERQWQAHSLHCAKRVVRMALMPLLGTKPLKSRELFK